MPGKKKIVLVKCKKCKGYTKHLKKVSGLNLGDVNPNDILSRFIATELICFDCRDRRIFYRYPVWERWERERGKR